MGFRRAEVWSTLEAVTEHHGGEDLAAISVETIVREALGILAVRHDVVITT